MLRIGLTGGIGSGKSTVAALFAARGVPVIDADVIARELVAPGQPALADIVATFGTDILDANGQLDRARLRARVFNDDAQRQRLEAILHPRIQAVMAERAAAQTTPYVLLVIPLLFEAGQRDLVDRVLVVDVPVAQQGERVAARDHLPVEQIEAIFAAQLNREQRVAGADDIIDNSGDVAALERQVDALHHRYLSLANSM
ncbi:MAG: dephospho-CoA kinase [Gammaproteobacteria bacterium]|nr:dephospho-CoA kinase [Gammaproteobacteria bacterium]